ncbi:MAG: outer membrane beta-barrel protein [Bacteroidetes bacterium]|nr:outer membrane beta-barrel protein [Bacteroidota bacterium]
MSTQHLQDKGWKQMNASLNAAMPVSFWERLMQFKLLASAFGIATLCTLSFLVGRSTVSSSLKQDGFEEKVQSDSEQVGSGYLTQSAQVKNQTYSSENIGEKRTSVINHSPIVFTAKQAIQYVEMPTVSNRTQKEDELAIIDNAIENEVATLPNGMEKALNQFYNRKEIISEYMAQNGLKLLNEMLDDTLHKLSIFSDSLAAKENAFVYNDYDDEHTPIRFYSHRKSAFSLYAGAIANGSLNPGLQIGLGYHFQLGGNAYFNTGVSLTHFNFQNPMVYAGYSVVQIIQNHQGQTKYLTQEIDSLYSTQQISGLRTWGVPLEAVFGINKRLQAIGGVHLHFANRAKVTITDSTYNTVNEYYATNPISVVQSRTVAGFSDQLGYVSNNGIKNLLVTCRLGFGYEISHKFSIEAAYQFGLIDVVKSPFAAQVGNSDMPAINYHMLPSTANSLNHFQLGIRYKFLTNARILNVPSNVPRYMY